MAETYILNSFLAGLATGAICVAVCGSVLLPVFLSAQRSIVRNYFILLSFCLGRFVVYIIFGVAIGWLGSVFYEFGWFRLVITAGMLVSGLLLLKYIRSSVSCHDSSHGCQSRGNHIPFVLGILAGINICPPFLVVITVSAGAGGIVQGVSCFMAFFLGTTLCLLPLPLFGTLSRWHLWTNIGRIAGVLVGFMLIMQSLSSFYGILYPDAVQTSQGPVQFNAALLMFLGHWQLWLPLVLILSGAVFVSRIPKLLGGGAKWIVWICAVGYLGFYRSNYFSINQLGTVIHGDLPAEIQSTWYIIFFFALISPLFFGRVYCRYVCPFGVLSEMLYTIVPFRVQLPPGVLKVLRVCKYILLIGAILLIVFLPTIKVELLEPFQAIFSRYQSHAYIIFGLTVLAVSCVIKRFWCTLFCLDGALFEQICKYRWKRKPKSEV